MVVLGNYSLEYLAHRILLNFFPEMSGVASPTLHPSDGETAMSVRVARRPNRSHRSPLKFRSLHITFLFLLVGHSGKNDQ
jgi:hypothetical protein